MRRLLLFIIKYRTFLLFVGLEFLCGFLIVKNNTYQSAAFLNSSNSAIAGILNISTEVSSYFKLRQTNENLANEINELKQRLESIPKNDQKFSFQKDFEFKTAKIINNSTRRLKNYLTINRGKSNNIKEGMAVIGGGGVVGKIKYTSDNYSVVTSLLHTDLLISAKVKNKVNLCSVNWAGQDPLKVELLYVPRNINLDEGDTVFTSGFDGFFPEDIPIGVVSNISIKPESTFLNGEVSLLNDFTTLSFVQVVHNLNLHEIDSLQQKIEVDE